jgi:hypothetical protein
MTTSVSRHPDGFALPAALLAMIVIGAIVTGGFYVSAQEHKVSISTDLGVRAMHVAEYGLEVQFAGLTTGDMGAFDSPGVHPADSAPVMSGNRELGRYTVSVMPLGGRLYLVESQGTVVRGQQTAVRKVAALARTSTAQAPFNSAITVHGKFVRDGASRIHGEDRLGVDRCGPDAVLPGVTVPHEDSVPTSSLKHGNEIAITGEPPVLGDATVTPDSLSKFGDVDLQELIASATLRYPMPPTGSSPRNMQPVAVTDPFGNQICDRNAADPDNWGEPYPLTRAGVVPACRNYYPIIHSAGNMDLATGRGQGILIVEGDLTIDGNFEFAGVVIVTGKFIMKGTSGGGGEGKIDGTVIVHGEGSVATANETSGNARIQWDSCAVQDALENNLRIQPFVSRAWISDPPALPGPGS